MAEMGLIESTNKVIVRGQAPVATNHKIESGTNMYAGRLVKTGTTVHDIVVHDGGITRGPLGWLDYEDTAPEFKPATRDTLYVTGDYAKVKRGGGFSVLAHLPKGAYALKGDRAISWLDGTVMPGGVIDGHLAIRVSFTKKASEYDTFIDFPTGILVHDAIVQAVTVDASGTIDIGLLESISGDSDGFVDGESLATAGFVNHVQGNTTEASNTRGVLIAEAMKDNTGTPKYFDLPKAHIIDGTAIHLSYKTSDHTVAGYFWVLVSAPGIVDVGEIEADVDATAAADRVIVTSRL